jgi:hypothetical protein
MITGLFLFCLIPLGGMIAFAVVVARQHVHLGSNSPHHGHA